MTTRLVETITLEKDDYIQAWQQAWQAFWAAEEQNLFEKIFKAFQPLLKSEWVLIENADLIYHHPIKAAWVGLQSVGIKRIAQRKSRTSIDDCINVFKKLERYVNFSAKWMDLPTRKELETSFHDNLKHAPFALDTCRPEGAFSYLFRDGNHCYALDCDCGVKRATNYGCALPLVRLAQPNQFNLTDRQVFFRFLIQGWLPYKDNYNGVTFSEYEAYAALLGSMKGLLIKNLWDIVDAEPSDTASLPDQEALIEALLTEDTVRADLAPYNPKMLTDINLGHWSLWPLSDNDYQAPISVRLPNPMVARDPQSSIVDGLVGIDFGTKSTVVVYQTESVDVYPLRIGSGRTHKAVSKNDYENPTVMQCIHIEHFMKAYQARDGRPNTRWEDLTASYTAASSMLRSAPSDFNTFVSELKQWAGDKNRKLKLADKQSYAIDLPSFLELDENYMNPIELYAYYLGLYINNQNNGIFLNYILSFPVTFERAIREKILQSFKNGLRKSLPQALHKQMNLDKALKVYAGTSEPAAYAAIALKNFGFDPVDDERVFYGVFDFGGGTTDFDFGIFREANGLKERRYDYVIEHFGAGGDRFLGGENLLEMLAFEVFKANKDSMLEKQIQFTLPPEGRPFVGCEPLLAQTREARMNTKSLMEALRPFWEGEDNSALNEGIITVNLFSREGQLQTNVELDADADYLEQFLKTRIQKGVQNFFHGLRKAFSKQTVKLSSVNQVHIFLAGNSSKSRYLKPLFEEEIRNVEADMQQFIDLSEEGVFKLYPPLEGDALDKPTGKTGVAFGLIETRKGGAILVIDHNTGEDDVHFKYYLGNSRKGKFKVVIPREAPYNHWMSFIDAHEDAFELFYSSAEYISSNQVPISDRSIKKKVFMLDVVDENAYVYIRLIDPTTIEYVVADEEGVRSNNYLCDPVRITLI